MSGQGAEGDLESSNRLDCLSIVVPRLSSFDASYTVSKWCYSMSMTDSVHWSIMQYKLLPHPRYSILPSSMTIDGFN